MTEQIFPIIIGFVLVAIVVRFILAIISPASRRRYAAQKPNSFTPPVQLYQLDPYSPPVVMRPPAVQAKAAHHKTQTSLPQVIDGSDYLRHGPLSHFETFQVGAAGEDSVAQTILDVLDERWTMFRNLDLPNSNNGDIDIVLVGPGGIWAIEVKTYTGNYRVENGRYYKETRNGYWHKDRRGPGAQVRTNAATLCNYLKQQGINYRNGVNRVVVMAGESNVHIHSTGTTVWRLDDLHDRLRNLNRSTYLNQMHVDRIVNVLREVAYSNRTMRVH
jgi:hypothetical protein